MFKVMLFRFAAGELRGWVHSTQYGSLVSALQCGHELTRDRVCQMFRVERV